jgi:hypothetical protein
VRDGIARGVGPMDKPPNCEPVRTLDDWHKIFAMRLSTNQRKWLDVIRIAGHHGYLATRFHPTLRSLRRLGLISSTKEPGTRFLVRWRYINPQKETSQQKETSHEHTAPN